MEHALGLDSLGAAPCGAVGRSAPALRGPGSRKRACRVGNSARSSSNLADHRWGRFVDLAAEHGIAFARTLFDARTIENGNPSA